MTQHIEKDFEDLLKYAVDSGIIDLHSVAEQAEMKRRQHFLNVHQYTIWQGSDGKWRTYLPSANNGRRLVKRSSRDSIEDAIVEYYDQSGEDISVEDVFEEWVQHRLEIGKMSKSTATGNRILFRRHFSDGFGNKSIYSVTPVMWSDFIEGEVVKKNLTRKAFNNLKWVVRGMLKRAKKRGLIDFSVAELFDNIDVADCTFQKKITPQEDQVFTEEELPVLIQQLKKNPDVFNLGILLILVTGIRVGELAALRFSDFSSPTVFRVNSGETKYRGEDGRTVFEVLPHPKTEAGRREVIIPDEYSWIYARLKLMSGGNEFVFTRNGKRIHGDAFRSRMRIICNKNGWVAKSPHDGRRTYASILLDNGVDINFITRQMGHTSIDITERHYHKDRKSLETKKKIVNGLAELC